MPLKDHRERYFMKDLKAERITIDPQTGEVTVIPGREESYERLLERHRQFASYGSMEEQTFRSATRSIWQRRPCAAGIWKSYYAWTAKYRGDRRIL